MAIKKGTAKKTRLILAPGKKRPARATRALKLSASHLATPEHRLASNETKHAKAHSSSAAGKVKKKPARRRPVAPPPQALLLQVLQAPSESRQAVGRRPQEETFASQLMLAEKRGDALVGHLSSAPQGQQSLLVREQVAVGRPSQQRNQLLISQVRASVSPSVAHGTLTRGRRLGSVSALVLLIGFGFFWSLQLARSPEGGGDGLKPQLASVVRSQALQRQPASAAPDAAPILAPSELTTPQSSLPPATLGLPSVLAQSGDQAEWSTLFASANALTLEERVDFWSGDLFKHPGRKSDFFSHLLAAGYVQGNRAELAVVSKKWETLGFVETVLALARSHRPSDFARSLAEIRYRHGFVTFFNQRVVLETQWMPENRQAGVFEDWSQAVAVQSGVMVAEIEKAVPQKSLLRAQLKQAVASAEGHAPSEALKAEKISFLAQVQKQPVVVTHFQYLPFGAALSNIPSGSLLTLVHKKNRKRPSLLTHQGIVVHRQNQVYFRHVVAGEIRQELLSTFLGRARQSARKTGWPLVGFHLLRVKDSSSASN